MIANVELNVESLRLSLCSTKGFDPRTLFDYFDADLDRSITSSEFLEFMKENFISKASIEVCNEIVSEYD